MADLGKTRGLSDELSRVQKRVSDALARENAPWSKGRLVANVRFEVGVDKAVPHKLGRSPTGFLTVGTRIVNQTGLGPAELIQIKADGGSITFRLLSTGTGPRVYTLWVW